MQQCRFPILRTKRLEPTYQNISHGIEAIYSDELASFIKIDDFKFKDRIIVGQVYSLKAPSCDGFSTNEKRYVIRGIVENFKGYDINCVVAKQIYGEETTIYQLNRNLCNEIGIDFEDRLQLLPLGLNWKHVNTNIDKANKEFNPNDLSTYPTQNGYINYIIVKLGGFSSYRPSHIVTSNGTMMNAKDFIKSFSITFKKDIDGDKTKIDIHDSVSYENITESIRLLNQQEKDPWKNIRRGCLCDENGNIYLKLDLSSLNIIPQMVENMSVNDIFAFSWTEKPSTDETPIQTPHITLEDIKMRLGGTLSNLADVQHPTPQEGMIRRDEFGNYQSYHDGKWISIHKSQVYKMNLQPYIF